MMKDLLSELYFQKMNSIFVDFQRICLQTSNQEILFLKYCSISDIGTFPQCIQVSNKYLNIQDGDIVLTNDPYSGGTNLTSPTLIIGIGLNNKTSSSSPELFLASRLSFPLKHGVYNDIDAEGLRIPPSPYYIKGILNEPMNEALKHHPKTPKGFLESINKEASRLLMLREKIQKLSANNHIDFGKTSIKDYLSYSEKSFIRYTKEIPEGSCVTEYAFTSEDKFKLKIEHKDHFFHFDFSGTTIGHNFFFTDSVTFGVVVACILGLQENYIPINSGVLTHFFMNAPRNSFVNSSFPRPVSLGHTEGINFIIDAVSRCMSDKNPKLKRASSGKNNCGYEIHFKNNLIYSDLLPVGHGASSASDGADGAFMWQKTKKSHMSIERSENMFPLQIISSGYRSLSGGIGRYTGGHGAYRTIKILEDAEFFWSYIPQADGSSGVSGGLDGVISEILIQRDNSTKIEALPHSGNLKLNKGDIITVRSPSGGGYGTKIAPE